MNIRNKLWEEIKFSRSTINTILWYTDNQRKWSRFYNIGIAVVATLGTFGVMVDKLIPFYSTLIVAIASFVKALFPQLIQSEQELVELDSISDYYEEYYNSLEHLWYNHENRIIDTNQLANDLFQLIKKSANNKSKMNRLLRRIPKKAKSKINNQVDLYLKEVFFDSYPSDNTRIK